MLVSAKKAPPVPVRKATLKAEVAAKKPAAKKPAAARSGSNLSQNCGWEAIASGEKQKMIPAKQKMGRALEKEVGWPGKMYWIRCAAGRNSAKKKISIPR